MKHISPCVVTLAMLTAAALAADQVVTLGDSLTFAYEAQFCFKQDLSPTKSIGDDMPKAVRNWVEILSNPSYRANLFELGARDTVQVTFPGSTTFTLYFRQAYNWAIPGLKIDGMRQFLAGEATFLQLLNADPDASGLGQILFYSNFNQATQFNLNDFENHVRNVAERVVISIGGNDVKSIYGAIYNGGSAGNFVSDFMADLTTVISRIQQLKPNVQIVVTAVPHVGITPKVKAAYPYDTVKTERVSAVLRELNTQIAALAAMRKIGFADIYTPCVSMIDPNKDLQIYGINYNNASTTTGAPARVWLGGKLSDNFHPNTNAQVLFANEIIDAFNLAYQSGIAPLSTTEVAAAAVRTPEFVDLTFAKWISNYGLAGQTASSDSDGDGVSAGVEFATGLNPLRKDSYKIKSKVSGGRLEIAFPVRLPSSANVSLSVLSSTTTPGAVNTPVTPGGVGTDGLVRATIPVNGSKGFMRLKATIP